MTRYTSNPDARKGGGAQIASLPPALAALIGPANEARWRLGGLWLQVFAAPGQALGDPEIIAGYLTGGWVAAVGIRGAADPLWKLGANLGRFESLVAARTKATALGLSTDFRICKNAAEIRVLLGVLNRA